jgi:hypothetical protein
MKYFNVFCSYELTIFAVPLRYVNAFITGLKPEVGDIWVIYLTHVHVCKHACTCNILTLHFTTELLSTAFMALNPSHKHLIREIRVVTLGLEVWCNRHDYSHAYYTRPATR